MYAKRYYKQAYIVKCKNIKHFYNTFALDKVI